MVIFFGTVTYGQADVVDKRFSVATEFFHIFYAPLFPIASYVIFDQGAPKKIMRRLPQPDDSQPQADEAETPEEQDQDQTAADQDQQDSVDEPRFSIPMSGKSVLLGYIRGWGFWLMVICGFLGGMLWLMSRGGDDPEAEAMFPGFLGTAAVGLVAAIASYYGPWNSASPSRAKQLCEAAGVDIEILPEDIRRALID